MMKLKHRNLFGLLLAVIVFFNKNSFPIIFDEINCFGISSFIGKNLFNEYNCVSDEDIYVLDYKLINDAFIIKPINNEVILPINGIIKNKTKNTITIATTSGDIKISSLDDINYYLYQYYNAYSILGNSKEYIINGNIELIINDYKIEYEKI